MTGKVPLMSHRWYFRSSAALVMTLFANAVVAVPGLEAAGLLSVEQRYGIDQDGNLVKPVVLPTAGQSVATPAAVRVAIKGSLRYGLDQNGELHQLAESAPVAAPVVAHVTPSAPSQRSAMSAVPIVATTATTLPSSSPKVAASPPRNAVTPVTALLRSPVPGPPQATVSGILSSLGTRLKSFFGQTTRNERTPVARVIAPVTPQQAPLPKGSRAVMPPVVVAAPLAKLRLPAKPATTMTSSAAAPRYSLKIDSLTVRSGARPVAKKLAENGVTILESRDEQSAQTVHRVVVGIYKTEEKAQKLLRGVQPKLKNAYIMSHKGSHGVYCGSFYRLEKAREKVAQLRTSGVKLTILRDSVEVKRTTILAGSYISRDEARDISLRLRRLGIPAVIVPGTESLAELRLGPNRERG